jgi:TRAP-type mannitol/chloroaromatic compound transport system substrate-binding protein
MFERRYLPVVVVLLVALLAAVVALWAVDRATTKPSSVAPGGSALTDKYQWKLVTTWPKNLPGLGAAPENFARYVEEMSDGRL